MQRYQELAEEILAADPSLIEEARIELEAQSKKGEEKQIALPEKFKREDLPLRRSLLVLQSARGMAERRASDTGLKSPFCSKMVPAKA